jgi:hypothetical protein
VLNTLLCPAFPHGSTYKDLSFLLVPPEQNQMGRRLREIDGGS